MKATTTKINKRARGKRSVSTETLPPHLTAAAYAGSCDPDGDIPCAPGLRRLEIRLAPHSQGHPRVPAPAGSSKPTARKTNEYGWVPDLPDARDHMYATPHVLSLPRQFDLRNHFAPFPPVYNQGQLGSCTANALAGAIQFERMRQRLPLSGQIPSRLFVYYNERVIENTVSVDNGAQIRDGIKSIAHSGTCFEGTHLWEWPYDIKGFAKRPRAACYTAALKDRAVGYSRLNQNHEQMRGCLASGYPFVFGFTVYESFESSEVAKTGDVPLPSVKEHAIGGHAVMAVGYDDLKQRFIIRNSWGPRWGRDGYGTMSYAYLTSQNLASDFWTLRLMSPETIGLPSTSRSPGSKS